MQSSRRGFMKLLSGLPIVGPSIAKEAVNLDALKIPLNAKIPCGNSVINDYDCDDCYLKDRDPYNKMDHIKEQLLHITRKSKLLKKEGLPKWMKQQWNTGYICKNFDPDLAINRSMSLVAKLHI